eukprot:366438-Chlamydomonas_euryale.AAC.13
MCCSRQSRPPTEQPAGRRRRLLYGRLCQLYDRVTDRWREADQRVPSCRTSASTPSGGVCNLTLKAYRLGTPWLDIQSRPSWSIGKCRKTFDPHWLAWGACTCKGLLWAKCLL